MRYHGGMSNTIAITFRLRLEVYQALTRYADAHDRSLNWCVNHLILNGASPTRVIADPAAEEARRG